MPNQKDSEKKVFPNLVGTKFVKIFREYLISLIEENKFNEQQIQKTCFLQKDVKSTTTSRYLKEMVDMGIFKIDDKGIYHNIKE